MATPASLRRHKQIEPELAVSIEIRGELFAAGRLRLAQDAASFAATFTYDPAYLAAAAAGRAFALDPVNLPLSPQPFHSASRYDKLGALFDAAPDAWGRTVMAADEAISPTALTESQVLVKGRGMGVGAILFSSVEGPPAFHVDAIPGIKDIPALYRTVAAVEAGVQVDERLRDMLMSSWDMGGARPKAVVRDAAGDLWIVKFPRKIDTYSRQRVEWANLEMARAIGMHVPDTQLLKLEGGDCALLVKRFDRGAGATRGQRQHYLSAVSLVSPPADFDKRQMDTPYGASFFSYARIADIVRQISANPAADLEELYARMVQNALIHNTDDHLKNTGFLLDPLSKTFDYRLSPLFDVVTQEGTLKHMLHMGPGLGQVPPAAGGRIGSLENILAGARDCGIRPKSALAIVAHVQATMAKRLSFYRRAGMSAKEIAQVRACLSHEIEAPA